MSESLPAKLQKRPFTYQEALRSGLSRRELARLLSEGIVERLRRGLYQAAANDPSEEALFQSATMSLGDPCTVCLLSALSFHNLTDEIPRQVWLLVEANKRSTHEGIRLVRARNPHWQVGINRKPGYSITTPARTIVDCLAYKRLVGTAVATEALRRSLGDSVVSLAELFEMARKLDVMHRVRPYLEAFA